MSDWWWIVFAALAIFMLVELFILRRHDAGVVGRSVIDWTGNASGERKTDGLDGVSDDDRRLATARRERDRKRQDHENPPANR